MSDSNFKTIEEFIDNMTRGGEVEFDYCGKQYSITHSTEGIHVVQAYEPTTDKVYKNPCEVLEHVINEKRLGDILNEMKVTFRCFH
jgi:hypothetical protein